MMKYKYLLFVLLLILVYQSYSRIYLKKNRMSPINYEICNLNTLRNSISNFVYILSLNIYIK